MTHIGQIPAVVLKIVSFIRKEICTGSLTFPIMSFQQRDKYKFSSIISSRNKMNTKHYKTRTKKLKLWPTSSQMSTSIFPKNANEM